LTVSDAAPGSVISTVVAGNVTEESARAGDAVAAKATASDSKPRRRGSRDNRGSFQEALQESDGRLDDSAHHGPNGTGLGTALPS
jgi:hypothetical protein